MTPSISSQPAVDTVDIAQSLDAVRSALMELCGDSQFREFLSQAFSKGPLDTLNRREREGRSHFKILYVSGNGFDAPLGTFLVLSVAHEAIGMPGFERDMDLHVRYTAPSDGFEKTSVSRSEEFRAKLRLCSNPAYLEKLLVAVFGR